MAAEPKDPATSDAATAAEKPIVVHPPLTGESEETFQAPAAPADAPRGGPTRPEAIEPFDADGAVQSREAEARAEAAGQAPKDRAAGLDAFRGLFLLAMNFAFTIPFGVFAQWMYHVQFPSPSGEFAEIPGLGWRDLLFGGFLFAMAAALPVTMGAWM